MKKVYVAGAYTGNNIENMRNAIDVGNVLLNKGYAPFIPHLTGLWDLVHAHDYETWMAYDKEWLLACDCLLRLPGASKGADQEVLDAEANGIPVYHSIAALMMYSGGE